MTKPQGKINSLSALICLVFMFSKRSDLEWWFALLLFVPLTAFIALVLAVVVDFLAGLLKGINKP